MTHKEYIYQFTKKYVLKLKYIEPNLNNRAVECYITNKVELIPTKPAEYESEDEDNWVFFNLSLQTYQIFPIDNIQVIQYPDFKNIQHINEILNCNDDKIITDFNNCAIERINNQHEDYTKIVNISKKFTSNISDSLIDLYKKYFMSYLLTDTQIIFNLIFGITPESYITNTFDVKRIRQKWFEVLNHYADKAITTLNAEKTKMVEQDDKDEIDIIIEMVNTTVEENKTEYGDVDNLQDIFESWPPILLPYPDFICDNDDNDTTYQDTMWALTT